MFTLLHELAHIVLGDVELGRFRIDEATNAEGVANDIERQADEQASAWIFPTGFSPPSRPVSASTIASLAREHGVHPSIVIGRLQRDGVLPIMSAAGDPDVRGGGQFADAEPHALYELVILRRGRPRCRAAHRHAPSPRRLLHSA